MKSTSLYPEFLSHLKRARLLPVGSRILVAVSGGLDSTVLCHLLTRLRERMDWQLVFAHVNYKRRGAASQADADFVHALGERYGVKTLVDQGFIQKPQGNFQAEARAYRYRLFCDWARGEGLQMVCTAHHRDDQVETILHRLLRGAGPRGLGGMRTLERLGDFVLVRPLLPFSKEKLEAYARHEGLAHREDTSNASPLYLRNRIRNELLPALQSLEPSAVHRIEALGAFFRELAPFLRSEARAFIASHVRTSEKEYIFSFDRSDFAALPLCLRHEVLYELFRTHLSARFVARTTIEKLGRLIVKDRGPAQFHLGGGIVFEKTAMTVRVREVHDETDRQL